MILCIVPGIILGSGAVLQLIIRMYLGILARLGEARWRSKGRTQAGIVRGMLLRRRIVRVVGPEGVEVSKYQKLKVCRWKKLTKLNQISHHRPQSQVPKNYSSPNPNLNPNPNPITITKTCSNPSCTHLPPLPNPSLLLPSKPFNKNTTNTAKKTAACKAG